MEKLLEVMTELVAYADLLIANEEDIQKSLGMISPVQVESGQHIDSYKTLLTQVREKFPQLEWIAVSLRESFSADENNWSGLLSTKSTLYQSKNTNCAILSTELGGDAFLLALSSP